MKIRFQADNDLNRAIVHALVRLEPMIDFQTAQAAQLHGVPDEQVLARSAAERRVLVSHDITTMPHHFADFLQSNTSAGVLIAPQSLAHNRVVEDLLLLWMTDEADDWINRICIMPL
jgi:precorrin-6B methylase 1